MQRVDALMEQLIFWKIIIIHFNSHQSELVSAVAVALLGAHGGVALVPGAIDDLPQPEAYRSQPYRRFTPASYEDDEPHSYIKLRDSKPGASTKKLFLTIKLLMINLCYSFRFHH